MDLIGCRCTSGDGGKKAWVASDDPTVWVHIQCAQPSDAAIRGQTILNLMRYGDHHNELVETSDLTSGVAFGWINSYRWTPEIVVGSLSGKQARVWVHESAATAR